ncbi:hypothetical protein Hanom_Chr08g00758921 [Helianthus anomalus]
MVVEITTTSTCHSLSFITIIFFLILVFTLFICSCILVLLILRNQIVHIALSFRKLHLIHTLTSVPMQESLTPEHSGELLADTSEHFLNGS